MRRVLIDHARQHRAARRGGPGRSRVALDFLDRSEATGFRGLAHDELRDRGRSRAQVAATLRTRRRLCAGDSGGSHRRRLASWHATDAVPAMGWIDHHVVQYACGPAQRHVVVPLDACVGVADYLAAGIVTAVESVGEACRLGMTRDVRVREDEREAVAERHAGRDVERRRREHMSYRRGLSVAVATSADEHAVRFHGAVEATACAHLPERAARRR